MSLSDFLKKKEFPAPAKAKHAKVAKFAQEIDSDAGAGVPCLATLATLALADDKKVAANDPAPDPDRHCYPHTEAANTAEISAMSTRLERFARLGLAVDVAERMADRLMQRDREGDDRHACVECASLSGRWRCSSYRQRGATAPGLPADYVGMLTRCNAWGAAS